MFPTILKFLKGFWFEIALGTLLGIMAVSLWATKLKLDACSSRRELVEAQASHLADAVRQQNDAIAALAASAEANRETYLAGLKAAEKRAVKLEYRAAEVMAMPEPAEAERCDAANAILKEVTQ